MDLHMASVRIRELEAENERLRDLLTEEGVAELLPPEEDSQPEAESTSPVPGTLSTYGYEGAEDEDEPEADGESGMEDSPDENID